MSRSPGRTRVTGGALRGRPLAVPPGIRPTEARVREALFSIWGQRLQGARFLDLFAGSGAVGLEALSRGAAEAVFVEASRRVAGVAEANAVRVAADGWSVLRGELPGALERLSSGYYDLVFADPPYDFGDYEAVVAGVARLLPAGGALAVEHSVRVVLPPAAGGLALCDERVYGESTLTFYEAAAER